MRYCAALLDHYDYWAGLLLSGALPLGAAAVKIEILSHEMTPTFYGWNR